MKEKDKIDLTDESDLITEINAVDTFVPYGELTTKLDLLAKVAKLKEQAEEPEVAGDTSVVKIYEFVKPRRLGLKKLILDRFKKN